MWKKIDEFNFNTRIIEGCIITNYPKDTTQHFRLEEIKDSHVWVVDTEASVMVRMFHQEELLNGKWWIEK